MKTSKKILTMSLLTILAAVSLTGCGKKKGNSKTIEVWHAMGKTNLEEVQRMTDEFLKLPENKGWSINFVSKGNYDQLKSDALKAIPARTLPTMAMCYPDHVADYLNRGVVENLDSYIEASNKESAEKLEKGEDDPYQFNSEDYIEAFWNEGNQQVKPGMYSVPFSKSTEVLFYNYTFFQKNSLKVPETWDEVIDLCQQIKAMPEVQAKETYEAPLGYDSDDNMFITFCEQLGIPYTAIEETADGTKQGTFLFDNDEAKQLITTLKGWYDNGYLTTKAILGNNTYTSTKFTEQELHLTVGSTGGTRYNMPEDSSFEVGVAPLPQWDKNADPKCVLQGPSYVFFNKYGTYTNKSQLEFGWKWYTYITNAENSAAYALLTGYEPVRRSSYQTAIYEAHLARNDSDHANSQLQLLSAVSNLTQELQDYYFTTPVFVGSATARTSTGGILAAVCGGKTVEAAFSDALNDCRMSQLK